MFNLRLPKVRSWTCQELRNTDAIDDAFRAKWNHGSPANTVAGLIGRDAPGLHDVCREGHEFRGPIEQRLQLGFRHVRQEDRLLPALRVLLEMAGHALETAAVGDVIGNQIK